MRFAVLGPGGVGGLLAGALDRAGSEVIVVARDANFKLYIEARDQGAFDLIATSSSRPLVAEALEDAAADVFQRREVQELLMLG